MINNDHSHNIIHELLLDYCNLSVSFAFREGVLLMSSSKLRVGRAVQFIQKFAPLMN